MLCGHVGGPGRGLAIGPMEAPAVGHGPKPPAERPHLGAPGAVVVHTAMNEDDSVAASLRQVGEVDAIDVDDLWVIWIRQLLVPARLAPASHAGISPTNILRRSTLPASLRTRSSPWRHLPTAPRPRPARRSG